MNQKARTDNPEPPPGNELAALLWVIAVLLGSMEIAWWFSERLYSQ